MPVQPRAYETGPDHAVHLREKVVDTAALPIYKFAKEGATGDGYAQPCAVLGERAMGMAVNSPHPSASNRQSDFADYAIADTAVVLVRSTEHVLVKAAAGVTAVSDGDLFTTDANGDAIGAVATNTVNLHGVSLETYGGVNYVRGFPAWQHGEVL